MRSLLLSFFILFLFGCGKKWKEPASVSFFCTINSDPQNANLHLTSGYLFIKKISFEGNREQGEHHVSFEKSLSSLGPLPLQFNPSNTSVQFDIPQGTYTDMEYTLETSTDFNGSSIYLNGIYIDGNNDSTHVIFSYPVNENIKIKALSPSGSDKIVLSKSKGAKATLTLSPSYIFNGLTNSELDDAQLDLVNSDSTIIIDNNHNANLFQLIQNRIESGCTIAVE